MINRTKWYNTDMDKRVVKIAAVILILACLAGAAAALTACDTEKYDAFIEAGSVQRIAYDGQVHYPAARLNHNETALIYEGGDVGHGACREPGRYTITISAAETSNYKAVSVTVTLIIDDSTLNNDVFDQMVERMVRSGDFDLDECLAIDVSLDLSFRHQDSAYRDRDWNYVFSVKGNIDFTNSENSLISISLYDNSLAADIMRMIYDGASGVMYVSMGGHNYKVENAWLQEALISASGADDGGLDEEKLSEHLKQAAAMVLGSGEVGAGGDVYTFDFHMDNLFTSTVAAVAEAFMPGVGEQLGRLMYGMLKEDIWSADSANLPAISGRLEIMFDGDKFAGIRLSDLDYADQSEEGVFFGKVSSVDLGNGSVDTLGLLPEDVSSFSSTKLLNMSAEGTMGVIAEGSETGRLGWSMDVNMDLAQFVISGGDFSDPLLQDNMFHLSLWYDPAQSPSSLWASSGDRAEALSSPVNILDVVYDPQNTGTSMVYVSFYPLALMSERVTDILDYVSNGRYSTLVNIFRDHSMLQLDINAVVSSMAFRQGETSEAFDALGGAIGFLSRLLAAVNVDGGAGNMNIADMAAVLDGDFGSDPFQMGFSLGEFISAVFATGEQDSDSLQIAVTEYEIFGSSTSSYNAVTSGLANNFNGTAKTYRDHYDDPRDDTPVMTPHIQGTYDEQGRFFISLYTQSLTNAVEYEVYDKSDAALSQFSAGEAAAIDEFAIGYTYTDIYGNLNENIYTSRIIRMEGYDPQKTGAQYVTIYTEPVEGYNILTRVDNMLRAYTDHKISFEGYRISGWIDVNAEISSARARAAYNAVAPITFAYSNGADTANIEEGHTLLSSSQFFASQMYEVEITYSDGTVKYVGMDAQADEFTFSSPELVSYSKQDTVLGYSMTYIAIAAGDTDMTLSTPLGDFTWHITIV